MSALRIADLAQGRDNNFNLIRFLAATAVIVFHCYALTAHWGDEPLWKLAPELNLGSLGVQAFFVVSGFLVTRSWVQRDRLVPFLAARALRIYPALFCATVATIALAAWASSYPLAAFLTDPMTLDYAWHAAAAYALRFRLPGAFTTNPFPDAVNGSLWTLPVEIRLYLALAVAGVTGVLAHRRTFTAIIAAMFALFAARPEWLPLAPQGAITRELALLFALGSLAYAWRDRIVLSLPVALTAIAVVALNPAGLARGPLFAPLLAYVLLVAAYHPGVRWAAFNRLGDYSYGLYIYAFPVQQTIAWRIPGIDPAPLFAAAFPLTLALAALSWHLIEKPALGLKSRFDRPQP